MTNLKAINDTLLHQILREVGESHIAFAEEGIVESQRGTHVLRFVTHRCDMREIVAQQGFVVGVGAVLDDFPCAANGAFASEVGDSLLGGDNVNIVLGGVDVATHGYDARDGSTFGGGGRGENGDISVSLVIARTSDAVHQCRTAYMRGVLVAIEVAFEWCVDSDDA